MRILSEQSYSKLRLAPADWPDLDDAAVQAYIEELRGSRSVRASTPRKAKSKDPSDGTSKPRTPRKKATTDGVVDDNAEF